MIWCYSLSLRQVDNLNHRFTASQFYNIEKIVKFKIEPIVID
jgi:hypothetical protein